jgi:toxin ParE1/3/4
VIPHRSVVFYPAAVIEARAAVDWYRKRSLSATKAFLTEFDHAISRISENPLSWPHYTQGTQRYLLHHFPFFLVYRLTSARIEIVAVVHAKRKPGYWKNRLE